MSEHLKLDIRWEQRFRNFFSTLTKLEKWVDFVRNAQRVEEGQEGMFQSDGSADVHHDLMKQGLIQGFEFTHELAWNVMRDYAVYQGNAQVGGSRDATREALQLQIITAGEIWMAMIYSRNQTSHTYNEGVANEIFKKITEDYLPAFQAFRSVMQAKIE